MVYTCEAFPERWASTLNNLGIAHYSQNSEERSETLEQAIACYQNALQVRTREHFPTEWAKTQNNLGNAYSERIQGNRSENLAGAIAAYRSALKVHTRELFPQEWAKIHNNLAAVHRDREELTEAIACFSSALQVYTPAAFPFECLTVGRNLGNTACELKDWKQAIAGFDLAVQAVEQHRGWASTAGRRQEILSAAIDVYSGAVLACLRSGAAVRALEYVERSKARNLVELLATRNLLPKGDIPVAVLNRLARLRREIGAEQRRLDLLDGCRSRPQSMNGGEIFEPWFADRTHLERLQQQLEESIQQDIHPYDPSFSLTQTIEPITFEQCQQLLASDRAALIEWYFTNEALLAFLLVPHRSIPLIWQSSLEDLQALEQWGESYLATYINNKHQWQEELSDRLHQLAEILHFDALLSLLPQDCLQLVLIPHRFLHILPLHALPLDNGSCLLNRFPEGVRYAPSCQLLHATRNRKPLDFQSLQAIQNPTGDLAYADLEVSAIQSLFPSARVLSKQEATKTRLMSDRDLVRRSCLHFACHGLFDLESPLESALVLAREERDMSSPQTRLLVGEIFDLELNPGSLVALSACETGLTDFKVLSDEYVGLPSGFLYAGASSVISSLWTVSDISTAFLMIKFYQNLKTGFAAALALNQAQLWLRDMTKADLKVWMTANPLPLDSTMRQNLNKRLYKLHDRQKPFHHPFHWAAFCAIGQ